MSPPDITPDVLVNTFSAYATASGGLTIHFAAGTSNSSAAQYIPDTVNGDTIKILETGIYMVVYKDRDTSAHASGKASITLNYVPVTTTPDSIPVVNLLSIAVGKRGGSSNPPQGLACVFVGWLYSGDTLKINSDGGYNGSTNYYACHWSVKKVGGI